MVSRHILGYVFVLFLSYGFVWCGITEQAEIQEAIHKFANVGSQEHHLNAAPENVEISTIVTNNQFVPSQRLEYSSVYNNVGFSTSDQTNVHQTDPLSAQWATTPLHAQFQGQQTESPFTMIEPMGSFIPSPEVRNEGVVNNHGSQPYYDNSPYSELINTNPFLSPEYFAPIDFTVPFNHPPPIQANAPNGINSVNEHNIVKSVELTHATPGPIHAESAPIEQYTNPISNFDVTFPSSASFYPKPNDWSVSPVSTPATQFAHSNSYSTIFRNTGPTFSESASGLQNQASVLPTPYGSTPATHTSQLTKTNSYSTIYTSTGLDYPAPSFSDFNVDITTGPTTSYATQPNFANFQNISSNDYNQPNSTISSKPLPLLTDEKIHHEHSNLIKCYFYKNGMLKRLKACKVPRKGYKRSPSYRSSKGSSMMYLPLQNHNSVESYIPSEMKKKPEKKPNVALGTLHHVASSEETEEGSNTQKPVKFLLKTTVHYPYYCKKLPYFLKDIICS